MTYIDDVIKLLQFLLTLLVIALKMPKVLLWDQARASIFTHQKLISVKIVMDIFFQIKGVSGKDLESMLSYHDPGCGQLLCHIITNGCYSEISLNLIPLGPREKCPP